jgi:hypothetical protein
MPPRLRRHGMPGCHAADAAGAPYEPMPLLMPDAPRCRGELFFHATPMSACASGHYSVNHHAADGRPQRARPDTPRRQRCQRVRDDARYRFLYRLMLAQ